MYIRMPYGVDNEKNLPYRAFIYIERKQIKNNDVKMSNKVFIQKKIAILARKVNRQLKLTLEEQVGITCNLKHYSICTING